MHGRSPARALILRLLVAVLVVVVPISVRGQAGVASRDRVRSPRTESQGSPERDFLPPGLLRPRPVSPGASGFPLIARAAGTIFSGTVASISRAPSVGTPAAETVAITFHVERAIRGASNGQDLTIDQWVGLWTSGQRYRVGENVLLFLYPPSKLGLTSCVGGSLGRFTVDSLGNVALTAEHQAAFKAEPLLVGKSQIPVRDFERAVQRARGPE